ncbi:MAG TPA: hypothetical protein VGA36_09095 [Nitriliruptorales bacterium]
MSVHRLRHDGRTTIARTPGGKDGLPDLNLLDDRSLLQLARGGDRTAARVLVGRYAGGIHAFVHARVGSLVAQDETTAIFAATIRALDRDALVDGSIARALHERAIARIVLDGQEIHDQRLDRLADVLAAESTVADPAPDAVVAAAVTAVLAAAADVPVRVVDGRLAQAAAPHHQPRRERTVGRQPAPIPPLDEPEEPEATETPAAPPRRTGLLILLLVLVALGAVVAGILLFGDADAIRDLL